MLVYCNMVMKYTPLILLSVLSVLLIPIMQTVNAQNPLDQLIGGLKNLTGGASKAVNNTASQAGQSLIKQDNLQIILQVKQDNLQIILQVKQDNLE